DPRTARRRARPVALGELLGATLPAAARGARRITEVAENLRRRARHRVRPRNARPCVGREVPELSPALLRATRGAAVPRHHVPGGRKVRASARAHADGPRTPSERAPLRAPDGGSVPRPDA